jgi:hypothetical protein
MREAGWWDRETRIPYLASRNSMKILLAIAAASEAALGFALLVYPPIASRRSARVDRSGDEWQRYPVGGLVSAFGWIVGCRRQALLAVDHRAPWSLSRLLEWNRHGLVRIRQLGSPRARFCGVCAGCAPCGVSWCGYALNGLESPCEWPGAGSLPVVSCWAGRCEKVE